MYFMSGEKDVPMGFLISFLGCYFFLELATSVYCCSGTLLFFQSLSHAGLMCFVSVFIQLNSHTKRMETT